MFNFYIIISLPSLNKNPVTACARACRVFGPLHKYLYQARNIIIPYDKHRHASELGYQEFVRNIIYLIAIIKVILLLSLLLLSLV